jgi:proteasome lid subunit RPN8/RPN11
MNPPPIDYESSKNLIRAHAGRVHPNECCGLLYKLGNKHGVICGRNIAEDPRHSFMLHPEDYQKAEDAGEILALYHSHVDQPPTPSDPDKMMAEKNNLPIIIVSWPADTWDLYEPAGWKAELIGRPFVYGVMDCWTLVQDYYKEKHGITLPDFQYEPQFWKKENLIEESLPKHGFVRVSQLQEGDFLLMQLDTPMPSHCAVYVGDGMILHHPPNHLSGYHPYLTDRGYYAQATVGIWRHKQLVKR